MLPPLPRCSGWAYSSLISPGRISLPRKGCRVGLHIVLFEACSAFTRVAACTLARSPIRDPLPEGFRHFVASMPAPVASGWSELPGGACTHWKAPPCHGAHPKLTFTLWRPSRVSVKIQLADIASLWSAAQVEGFRRRVELQSINAKSNKSKFQHHISGARVGSEAGDTAECASYANQESHGSRKRVSRRGTLFRQSVDLAGLLDGDRTRLHSR